MPAIKIIYDFIKWTIDPNKANSYTPPPQKKKEKTKQKQKNSKLTKCV